MAGPFLIFFTLIWTAGIFFFDGMVSYQGYKQYESGSFPAVTGNVTQSDVERRTGSKGRTYYVAVVKYEYNVSGQTFFGDRLRFGMGHQGNAYAIVNAHPVNSPVQVYYNPKDPNESLLYPGFGGSDMLGALFLTPFNMMMIGFWGAAWMCLKERLFKPAAGGVKIITDGMTTRVRLPTVGAIVWGLGTTGALGFVSIFVVGFGTGFEPSIPTVVLAVCVIYLAGAGVWFWQQQKINTGIDDLVINEGSGTMELPLTFGRKERMTVPFSNIENIWVKIIEHHSSKGGTSYTYAPMLNLRNQLDNQKLAEWGDKLRADDFTEWLSKKIGVTNRPAISSMD